MTEKMKPDAILGLIRGVETSRGYEDYSRYATVAPPKPMTQMTVREVQQWQSAAKNRGSKSVAAGGYQIISKTFNGLVQEMGLTGDEVFDKGLQDRMGMQLLNRRGYNKWLSGQMTNEQFADNLAMEWAALPRATGPKRGRSHYAGDGLNGSRTNVDTVFQALEASRNGEAWEFTGASNKGGGVPVTTAPAETERRLKLADLDPNQNHTGADMGRIGAVGFETFRSTRDDKEAAQASQPEAPGFWEGAGLAVDEGWIATNVARQMGKEEFKPDFDFQFSEELWKEIATDVPEGYQEALYEATSEAHARALAVEIKRQAEQDAKLSAMGWKGTGLRVGAALLDPVAIAASVVTEGMAAPVIYGAKIGRLGRFLRAGTAAGAVNAGIEGYLASQNPIGQWEDVAFAAAAGFVIGGAFGAVRKIPEDDALLGAIGATLDSGETSHLVSRANAIAGAEVEGSSVGAAQVISRDIADLSPSERARLESENAPRTATPLNLPRVDMVGRLKLSEVGITRRLAALLGEDGVGNADGSVNVRSVTENVKREERVRFARFYRTHSAAYNDWRKEQGLSLFAGMSPANRTKFNNAVGMAVRRELSDTSSPSVRKVAEVMKREFQDLLEFGREHNIRGFKEVRVNNNYMTRKHRIQSFDDFVTGGKFRPGDLKMLFAGSIMSANKKFKNLGLGHDMNTPEIDYGDALKLADAYIKSIRSRRYGEFGLNRALAGQDMDTLKMMLDDAGLSTDEITRITDKVRLDTDSPDRGRISNAKRRLDIDETHSMDVYDLKGNLHTLRIEDFLENDAEQIFTQYTRSVLGAGFMEDALSSFKVPDAAGEMPTHAPSFETVKGYIRDEAQSKNLKDASVKSEMRKLDTLYRAAMGISQQEPTRFNTALRMMRDYNFVRIGGQLGVAQLAETGNILGQGGVRVFMQQIPALKGIYQSARAGKFKDDLFNEIEAIWGFGTDLSRASPSVRMDDTFDANMVEAPSGTALNKLDNVLQQGKIVTSVASGMSHVNMALQRFTGRVLVQRFMDDATGRRGINVRRLRSMGVSEDMHPRIQAQLQKHVDQSKGLLGRRVQRINIENWDDLDARNAFVNAVDRWSKKVIQENDIGNMPAFMTHEMGKTIAQFRSFMIAAYTKQLLSGIHHRDWETFSAFATSMFFGGLFYAGQQTVNSIGRADQQEWLDRRLEPSAIGRAAFQRAGFSSFIPPAVDFGLGFAGIEPVFDFRSSGLANGGGGFLSATLSNPTIDLINTAERGVKGIGAAVMREDYDYSRQDWDALSRAFFFQNAFVVRNGLAALGSNLPHFSQ